MLKIYCCYGSILLLPDFAMMLDAWLYVYYFRCLFFNEFLFDSKKYLVASSSLHEELLVASIKLNFVFTNI